MERRDHMPATPKEHLRTMRILNVALVAGAALFAVIAIVVNVINGKGAFDAEDVKKTGIIFLIAAALLAAICFYRAVAIYKKKVEYIRNNSGSLMNKLNQYYSALILYLALCEGATIFSVIVFFLTGDYKSLIISALMLAAMIAKMPTQKKISYELGLNWSEEQEFY